MPNRHAVVWTVLLISMIAHGSSSSGQAPDAAGASVLCYAELSTLSSFQHFGNRAACMLCRTLTNGRSAMLTAMFSGALPLTCTADGRVFIDRDGEHFGTVLSFLRTGTCPKLPASGGELAKLLDEAEFYQARRFWLCQL